jgi:hypothetical protein
VTPSADRPGLDGGVKSDPQSHDQLPEIRATLIQRLERQIDLPAWLVAQGFHLSPVQPDLTRLALSDRYGETLHLRQDLDDGRWSYSRQSDPTDRGSLVDLMVRRDGSTLDACVDRMGACLTRSNRSPEAVAYREAYRDRDDVLHRAVARHVAALKAERDAVRDLERLGVDRGTYDEWRFGPASTVLRNPDRLEHSRYRPTDTAIVFTERPLDAVAYERSRGHQQACYVYTGDNPSPETKRTIAHLLRDAPESLRVVLAFGRDRQGSDLSKEVAALAPHRQVDRQGPDFGARWADQMQIEQRHRDSLPRLHRCSDPVIDDVRREMAKALDAGVDRSAIRTAVVRRQPRGREGFDR